MKARHIISRVSLILLGLFLGILSIEIVLRLAGFGQKVLYERNSPIKGDYRILCIGESTTWGIGAEDPRTQSYPKQLQRVLNRDYKNMEMRVYYNYLIGQNTSEIADKLPGYIKSCKPHLVIIMCGANNWWNMDKSNILLFNNNKYISDFTLKTLVFLDRFRFWKMIKWLRISLGIFYKERYYYFRTSDDDKDIKMDLKETERMYGRHVWETFDKLAELDIANMVKVCKRKGIKVIISSYPMECDELRFIQEKIAKKFDIPFADNYIVFKGIDNVATYLSKDGWHPNERGYKIVAQNIYKTIKENGMIDIERGGNENLNSPSARSIQ